MTFDSKINQLKTRALINSDPYAYQRVHLWINRLAGKADHCSLDESHQSTRYHWANISGEYKRERSDWRQLCPSCNIKTGYTDELREIKRLQAIGNTSHNKPIVAIFPDGSRISYPSSRVASEGLGVSRTSIANIINGWAKKTHTGLSFKRVGG